jgi:hypothetical protein
MKTWEMRWGKEGQFEGFWIHAGVAHGHCLLEPPMALRTGPHEPKEADASQRQG